MARFRSPAGVVVSVADGKAPVGYTPVAEPKPAADPKKAAPKKSGAPSK